MPLESLHQTNENASAAAKPQSTRRARASDELRRRTRALPYAVLTFLPDTSTYIISRTTTEWAYLSLEKLEPDKRDQSDLSISRELEDLVERQEKGRAMTNIMGVVFYYGDLHR